MAKKEKIVIIGGGISSLTAGIYAQKCGFESIILEKHSIVGGECTGWDRHGYHIDNCIHWMTGTNPQKAIYSLWKSIGALGPDIPIIQNDAFLRIDGAQGKQLMVWQDTKRLHDDLVALAPEDKDEIGEFIHILECYKDVEVPCEKPMEQMSGWDKLKLLWQLRRAIRPHLKYASMSVEDYAQRFRNPLLRRAMLSYLPKHYFAEALFYVFATFMCGNGAIPKGGSRAMAQRIEERYKSLGGTVRVNAEVEKINIEGTHVTGVTLRSGEVVPSDILIAGCDPRITFYKLLDPAVYLDDYFSACYSNDTDFPIFSQMNIYCGTSASLTHLPDQVVFHTQPVDICGKPHEWLCIKQYGYEPDFAPQGRTVMQLYYVQYADDFDYWSSLRQTGLQAYKDEKMRVARQAVEQLEQHFPELKGTVEIVEIVTPYSFYRYCGAYKGSYMSFIRTKHVGRIQHNGRIKGLDNGYLCGQWLQNPGGLPNAVVAGKFAIQRICKDRDIEFCDAVR